MTEETESMRDARHELEMLSASDPIAQANMLRHVVAFRMLLTGHRYDQNCDDLLIAAGFILKHRPENLLGAACRMDARERIHIGFDVDDAAAPPLSLALFVPQWGQVTCYDSCRIWSPANDGRALIVPSNDPGFGHYAYRPGAKLRRLHGLPSGDLDAGFRRADARIARLLKSDELTRLRSNRFLHVLRSGDGELACHTTKLAA
ncbi:hypothetical protein [Sphingomonas sp. BAUL-RG-20F-R05-02]|uniref:hypothetical protein n=1 Tax=Sphingomonas sp. BAUL-RG-20F-R05-02 TaxID=2914830 RepID=UPI001F58F450|nr:hypothetical protein [Sphingomonas sp. BAUL-RG-20F-R05-02]